MSNFNDGCYSCTPGTELMAKVIAGKCQMHYTRAAVGSGKIPAGKTPESMTEPADYVMDALISSVSVPVDGQCQVTLQINSSDVDADFLATCILLYAQDPDIGEVPYSYLVLENNPEQIKSADSDVGKLAVFDLITAVGTIDSVSADFAPNAVITRSELDDVAAQKVDKISGKGLSTEDFTTNEKIKLAAIESGAQANSITGVKGDSESSYRTGNVNITPANIGAAPDVHTHNYAGSQSVGGAADSALKLASPKYISLGKGFRGSASFDGSSNITIDGELKRSIIYNSRSDYMFKPWHKFAEITVTKSAVEDYSICFLVSGGWGNVSNNSGILTAHFRAQNKQTFLSGDFGWLICGNGISPSDFVMVYINSDSDAAGLKVELWYQMMEPYGGWTFTVLNEHILNSFSDEWSVLSKSGPGSPDYTSGSGTIVSSLIALQNPLASE